MSHPAPGELDLSALMGAAANLSPDAKFMLLQQLQQQLGLAQPHVQQQPAAHIDPAPAQAVSDAAHSHDDDDGVPVAAAAAAASPVSPPPVVGRRDRGAAGVPSAASKLKYHHTMPHPRKNTPVGAHPVPSITPSSSAGADEEHESGSGANGNGNGGWRFDSLTRMPSSLTNSGHFGSPVGGATPHYAGSLTNTKSSLASLTSTAGSTSHTPYSGAGTTHPGLINSASSVGMGMGSDSTGRGGRFHHNRLSAQEQSDSDSDDEQENGGSSLASDALDERDVSLGLRHAYDSDADEEEQRAREEAQESKYDDVDAHAKLASARRRSSSCNHSDDAAAATAAAAAAPAAVSPLALPSELSPVTKQGQAPGGAPISSRDEQSLHSRSATPSSPSAPFSSNSSAHAIPAAVARPSPPPPASSSHTKVAAKSARRSSCRQHSHVSERIVLASSSSDYTLGEQIGSGVHGKVFKASSKQSGGAADVAIKVVVFDSTPMLSRRDADDSSGGGRSNNKPDVDCREEVRREVDAWAAMLVAHPTPNLLPVYGALEHGVDQLWVVSQLQELGSCADVLTRRRKAGLLPAAPAPAPPGQQFMPERLAAVVLRGALLGLQQLYACYPAAGAGGAAQAASLPGHGSVRCSTLLLDGSGSVRLADRAAAQRLDTTFKPAGMSLVFYMAPESIAEASSLPRPCDVWAVGIAAIELIDAAPPHAHLLPLKVCSLIPRGPAPSLRHPDAASDDMADFVSRCCAKLPEQRWSVDQLLQHPLIVAAADVPPSELAAFASEHL